ncbi:MAG: SWIB/MDM2 domain protein [Terrestrivirus sp.]|uniref:SWIB/MDM2 domain protein n=1 Tax=Terrestrivirus sp. TaxID=2487775 RepID=A0A3G4ZR37_9VIRU|nr:MAG: SWIB/MDM2 domain protein [Terrestrivirus sp.]
MDIYKLLNGYHSCLDKIPPQKILKEVLKGSTNNSFLIKYIKGYFDQLFDNKQKNVINESIFSLVFSDMSHTNCYKILSIFTNVDNIDINNISFIKKIYLHIVSERTDSFSQVTYLQMKVSRKLYNKNEKLLDFETECFNNAKSNNKNSTDSQKILLQFEEILKDHIIDLHEDLLLYIHISEYIIKLFQKYNRRLTVNMLDCVLLCNYYDDIQYLCIISELENYVNTDIIAATILNRKPIYLTMIKKPYNITINDFIKYIDSNDTQYNNYNHGHQTFMKSLHILKNILRHIDHDELVTNNDKISHILFKYDEIYNEYNYLFNESVISQEFLYKVCRMCPSSMSLIKLLSYKLLPDRKCFELICESIKRTDLFSNLEYEGPDEIQLYLNDVIKIFFTHGFVIDSECIAYALKRNLVISDLEDYDIKYDETLFKLCEQLNVFPDEYKDKKDKKLVKLSEMFAKNKIDKINTYMKKFNVTPDTVCFKNAFKNPNLTAKHIIDLGYNPSMKDIVNIDNNDLRRQIYEHFFGKGMKTLSLD